MYKTTYSLGVVFIAFVILSSGCVETSDSSKLPSLTSPEDLPLESQLSGSTTALFLPPLDEIDIPEEVEAEVVDGQTLLHVAVFHDKVELLSALLTGEENPNVLNGDCLTPLHLAVTRPRADIRLQLMQLLLEAGAKTEYENCRGERPLHLGAKTADVATIAILIDAGAEINSRDARGRTPLHAAISNPYISVLEYLVEAGAEIDVQDEQGMTPFHLAVDSRRPEDVKRSEAIRRLIHASANLHVQNSNGETPLDLAVLNYDIQTILTLAEAGARIPENSQLDAEPRRLFLAAIVGDVEAIRRSLRAGVGPSVEIPTTKETPLLWAAASGQVEAVQTLLNAGAQVDELGRHNRGPLHWAAMYHDNVDVIRLLLEVGTEIDGQQFADCMPLHIAILQGREDSVRALLDAGAPVTGLDGDDLSPLCSAIFHNQSAEIVSLLVDAGAEVNVPYGRRRSALRHAIDNDRLDIIEILLEAGVNTEENRNYKKNRPLHEAVEQGRYEVARRLLEFGTEVNSQENYGETPLDKAREEELQSLLRSYGGLTREELRAAAQAVESEETKAATFLAAIRINDRKIVQQFIDEGISLDSSPEEEASPLAVSLGLEEDGIIQPEMFELLIESGADLNAEAFDDWKTSILSTCVTFGKPEPLSILLEAGADPDLVFRDDGLTPLHYATKQGRHQMAQMLLDAGADPMPVDRQEATPLIHAVKSGDAEMVQIFIENEVDLEFRTEYESTPIEVAAAEGQAEIVRVLIEAGASFEASDRPPHLSPMLRAAWNGHAEVLRVLIEAGVDIEAKRPHPDLRGTYGKRLCGSTALQSAAIQGQAGAVRVLLEAGAAPDTIHDDIPTPLICAVEYRHAETFQLLLEAGADPERKNTDGLTPLAIAVKQIESSEDETFQIIRLLIEVGADLQNGCDHDKTPLHYAFGICDHDDRTQIIETLLEAGADREARDAFGRTPLWYFQFGWYSDKILDDIIRWELNVNTQNDEGFAPLYGVGNAGYFGLDFNVADTLLKAGARLSDKEHPYRLHVASLAGDVEAIQKSLNEGDDPNFVPESRGTTPIYWAAGSGNAEAVKLLLDAGADARVEAQMSRTTLHQAAECSDSAEMVRLLVEAGADILALNYHQQSPLHLAVAANHTKTAGALIETGLDVDTPARAGTTPLIYALSFPDLKVETLQFLIDSGANVNARSEDGRTVLMYAVQSSRADLVAPLLDAGADVHDYGGMGRAPQSFTENEEILAVLRLYGG
jgi:cytohesin